MGFLMLWLFALAVPVMMFWLWVGFFSALSFAWARMLWHVWLMPAAVLIALVCGTLFIGHELHKVFGNLAWLVVWVALPIAIGVSLARKYPHFDRMGQSR